MARSVSLWSFQIIYVIGQQLTSFPQPYVTEMDLRHSLIPDEVIEHLVKTMPPHEGPDLLEDRDLPKFDYISFMNRMIEDQKRKDEE